LLSWAPKGLSVLGNHLADSMDQFATILGAKCVSSGSKNGHEVDALSSQSGPEFALLGGKRLLDLQQSPGKLYGSICDNFGS